MKNYYENAWDKHEKLRIKQEKEIALKRIKYENDRLERENQQEWEEKRRLHEQEEKRLEKRRQKNIIYDLRDSDKIYDDLSFLLTSEKDEEFQITIINSFRIPQNEQDLQDIIKLLLRRANKDLAKFFVGSFDVTNACVLRIEDCLQRAHDLFPDNKIFEDLQHQYELTIKTKKEKQKKKILYIGIAVAAVVFFYLILGLLSY